ncbi:unnamed protein product [Symbiodinium natans]|uniref:RNA-dependent RNA polymerase n=1 Tax=Symbiodinium natans TaxID=878477 RepID=A0A812T9Z2_9DINO|nr:unnamed protein product [Symbiodinium natans]
MQAVLPTELDSSRLSREIGDIASVDWKCGKRKPEQLVPLIIQGVRADTVRPTLQAVVGKEDGLTYYASQPLRQSVSAMRLLTAAQNVQEAYSRLPLLLSPSTPCVVPQCGFRVEIVEDDYPGEDRTQDPTTDGASDVGTAAAVRLGLIKSETDINSYSPTQFRGLLRVGPLWHVLVKGMLMIDCRRKDGLHIRRSCSKLHMHYLSPVSSEHLGLDLTQNTEAAMQAARINCQTTAALAMRAMAYKTEAARVVALGLLDTLLQTLQAATVLHFASMAWGIKNSLLEAPAEAVKRLSPPAPTRGDKRQAEMNEERQFVNRVGKHEVTVRAAADEEEVESDLAQLTKEVEEMHPWDLARGTKRAVLGGGGAFNGLLTQCRHDPQLVLPGGAWVLTSLPDIWKGLEDKQCYVFANGVNIVGRVAVWRSPVVQPGDIQVWEAKEWPAHQRAPPRNCIVCTVRGPGVTALSGGDSDGDTVFVTLNADLIEFLDHTEPAVAALDLEGAAQPKKELEQEDRIRFSLCEDRTPEYLRYMLRVPTLNVRGLATAMAEKCQQAVYESPGDPAKYQCMLRVGFLCQCSLRLPQEVFWAVRLGRHSPRDACSRHRAEHLPFHVCICVDSVLTRPSTLPT